MENQEFGIGDAVDVLNPDRVYTDPIIGWYQGVISNVDKSTTNPCIDPEKLFYKVRKIDDPKIELSHASENLRLSLNPNID